MRVRVFSLAVFLAAAANTANASAAPQDCQLKMLASVPTETDEFGSMLLPGNFGGTQKALLVDTGGVFHMLRPSVVKELNLPVHESSITLLDALGQATDHIARAPAFSIGAMTPVPVDFVVAPEDGLLGDDRVSGVFFPGVYYRSLDVDLDFVGHKFSLFSQDHCAGTVVYWPNTGVAVVPIRFDDAHHIVLPVKVDGSDLMATLDSGASDTTMFIRVAERLGVDVTAPGTTDVGQVGDNPRVRRYEHRFQSLAIEGITVSNPLISLIPDLNTRMAEGPTAAGNDTRFGAPRSATGSEMLVGMSILRHLHVFIAAKEEKLYITAGDAAPASP